MPNIYLSPEDRASNTYAPSALWNGKPTNEKEQMAAAPDLLETALTRCGFTVRNVQRGNMYDRVRESNDWPAALHIALHTNGFNGKASGTRVHCYPSEESRRIGRLIQDRIAPLSPGGPDKLVESAGLYELRATHMPAVLPEFGFHDEPEEARWLIDSMPQIAEETCKAVCDYFGMGLRGAGDGACGNAGAAGGGHAAVPGAGGRLPLPPQRGGVLRKGKGRRFPGGLVTG